MEFLRIALRYLFSRKTHTAVNVISLISVLGVAVATMAVVVVLSVFNGFADLSAAHLSVIDPALKVTAARGKVIADADSVIAAVGKVAGVTAAVPAIDERALLVADGQQVAVKMKAVPAEYALVCDIPATLIDGVWLQHADTPEGAVPAMVLSAGVASQIGMSPGLTSSASLYVPRRVGRINPANPATAFRQSDMMVSGIFLVKQSEYDADHVIVPLEQARDLLDYTTEATSVDIAVDPAMSVEKVRSAVVSALGDGYKVSTRIEQQEQSFRMISIEKWMTFAMLAFILVIAAFNIISTLSLLVIEKHDNILTLRALGANRRMIARIFVWQGWLISVAGGILGIVLGVVLSLVQQYGRVIKLAADPSVLTIDAYPVRLSAVDVLVVFALVIVVGAITSQTTRLFLRKYR